MNSLRKSVENRYECFNPLLLCKTFYVDRCDEAVEKRPIFNLGTYLFRTLYKIAYHNYYSKRGTKNDFDSLYIYINIMKEIGIKENSDLCKQTL